MSAGLWLLSSELDRELVPGGQAGCSALEPGHAKSVLGAPDWVYSGLRPHVVCNPGLSG